MQPTLREILELPVVQAGDPELVCDGPLDTPVRWVHVSDLADLSGLLTGGGSGAHDGAGADRPGPAR